MIYPDADLLPISAQAFLLLLVVVATITDVSTHRIPNVLLAPVLAIALVTAVVSEGAGGLLMAVAGIVVGLGMLLPLYVAGGMAAGDVKLLGVVGAFLGPAGTLIAGLATFIAGAVLGVLWILWRRLGPRLAEFWKQSDGISELFGQLYLQGTAAVLAMADSADSTDKNTFAYAPAIAIGTAVATWQQGWWLALPVAG